VGYCDRVGRNLIRLEVKKLYEGVPAKEIRHWHKFAVEPLPVSAYPAVLNERNIAKRAQEIIYGMVELGEALTELAWSLNLQIRPEKFVCLRRRALDYAGWWTFDIPKAIALHVPLKLREDAFLDRCMSLVKLIIEGLDERSLRAILLAAGAPEEPLANLRTLRLLDRLVCLAQVANESGLVLAQNGPLLWERLASEGTNPPEPIGYLFALYDVRNVKAHKSSDPKKRLQDELKRFGVQPGEEAAGYGKILDRIYDLLASELNDAVQKIQLVV
jgi:hypothetical protein